MADSQAAATLSPLAAIRDKERTLQQAIKDAQERAAEHVATARARADAIKEQAERDGLSEAETLYQDGLARARTEAEALQKKGEAEAASAGQVGRSRIARGVEHIVQFVLPRTDSK